MKRLAPTHALGKPCELMFPFNSFRTEILRVAYFWKVSADAYGDCEAILVEASGFRIGTVWSHRSRRRNSRIHVCCRLETPGCVPPCLHPTSKVFKFLLLATAQITSSARHNKTEKLRARETVMKKIDQLALLLVSGKNTCCLSARPVFRMVPSEHKRNYSMKII